MEDQKEQAFQLLEQQIMQLANSSNVPDQIRELRLAAMEGQADFAAALMIISRGEADSLIIRARNAAANAKASIWQSASIKEPESTPGYDCAENASY